MIQEDIKKYIAEDFKPLNDYIETIIAIIDKKVNENLNNRYASFEYRTRDNKKAEVYIMTKMGPDINDSMVSFYFYNSLNELIEMIDFTIFGTNRNKMNRFIKYSAILYEDNIAKTVSAGYQYQDEKIIGGWIYKFITSYEIGHFYATHDGLENLQAHLKKKKEGVKKVEEPFVRELKLHY